jgi:hypothetical protein
MPDTPQQPSGPPVPPDYFERFVEELEGIRRGIEVTNSLLPKQAADTAKKLADFYETGMSGRQSQPSASVPPPVPPGWAQQAVNLSDLRQAQGDQSRASASVPARPRPRDDNEDDARAQRKTTSVPPVRLRDRISNWQDDISPDHYERGVLEIPRSEGGHFTAADLLNFGSETARGLAARRLKDEDTPSALTAGYGKVGGALHWAAEQAPKAALLRQYAQRFGVVATPGGLEAEGAALNTSPSGTAQAGPFGFRVPFFNAAARQGMEREWGIMKMRAAGGINGGQARFIYDQLNARGFQPGGDFGGGAFGTDGAFKDKAPWLAPGVAGGFSMRQTPGFNDMAQSAKWMTQNHPQLVNEQYFDLMDKATRAGGTSLESFNRNDVRGSRRGEEHRLLIPAATGGHGRRWSGNEEQGGTHAQGQVEQCDSRLRRRSPPHSSPA